MDNHHPNAVEETLRIVLDALGALAADTKRAADDCDRQGDEWRATIKTGEYVGVIDAYNTVSAILQQHLKVA